MDSIKHFEKKGLPKYYVIAGDEFYDDYCSKKGFLMAVHDYKKEQKKKQRRKK